MEMEEHEKQWLTGQGAKMVATLGVKERHSVIDFGCGKGRYSVPISQVIGEHGNVLSVERDADEVAVFRERMKAFGGQGTVSVLNAEELHLPSVEGGTIDNVFAFDVLQYVEDWETLFKSVRRVLKPGGRVHVYPASIPHPGAVDMKRIAATMKNLGLHDGGKQQFHMMHNKDMVDDEVYTFSLAE